MRYLRSIQTQHGKLRLYANDTIYAMIPAHVYKVADRQLQMPKQTFFSLTPDVHVKGDTCIGTTAVWHAADGYISPSIIGGDIGCGIRVYLTNLHQADITDMRLRRKIIRSVEKVVPLTEQMPSHYRSLSLSNVVRSGLPALPAKFLGQRSLTHVEFSSSPVDTNFLADMSEKSIRRARDEFGSLGNGNHFIELQSVFIAEKHKDIAKEWGLFDGQVICLIHTGSRAWGKALAALYTKDFAVAMNELKLSVNSHKLLYLPLSHPVGRKYMRMMGSALHYAVSNRHLIGFALENALKRIFGDSLQITLLYDLMHNYASQEMHRGQEWIVHHKGTTKALPALHPDNPAVYLQIGHPALIPGSMGTPSYIMVGEAKGEENYHSICHGAGRMYSHKNAKQPFTLDERANSLKLEDDQEVAFNRWTKERFGEESPATYKSVEPVIDTIVGAKLASVVAKCTPMIVIKAR